MFESEKVEEIGRYVPWLFAILFIIAINIPVFSYSAGEKEVLFFLASLDATSVSFTSGISVLLLSFAAISSPFFSYYSYYSDNKVGKVLGISLSLVTLCFSIAILRAYAVYAGNLKLEETSFTGAIMLLLLAIANLFYCFCFSLVSTRQKPKWHRVSPIKISVTCRCVKISS